MANLITRDVKKTGRELVVRAAMSTPALRGGFMQRQTAVRGIILTANAVPLLRPPVVRPIIRSPVTRHAAHPERIPAAIPVIVAAMTTARQGLLKTIPVLMLLQPNAGQDVTDVKIVLQAVPLIQVLMSDLPNAALAMPATTHVNPVRNQFLVLGMKIKLTFIQPNVEHVVMNVAITQIALQQKNPAHMAVLLQTPAAYAQAAIQNHQYPAKNITHGKVDG